MHELHNYLPFLPERIKIEKVEKLVANLHDKKGYVIQIGNLKETLNPGLVLKEVHRAIRSNQKAWPKFYSNIYTELRKNAKNDLKKDILKLKKNTVFGKTMENVKNHRYINLVTTEGRRNYLVLEPNYHTTKILSKNLLAIEMKKHRCS